MKYLILDNGSYTIKAGYSTDEKCTYFFNALAKLKSSSKTMTANSFFSSKNNADCQGVQLKTPFEKGILTNFNFQKYIWDDIFDTLKVDQKNTCLVITEPIFNLPNISQYMMEIILEEYSFAKVILKPGFL